MDSETSWRLAYEREKTTSHKWQILYNAKCFECDILRGNLAKAMRQIESRPPSIYDRFQREDA